MSLALGIVPGRTRTLIAAAGRLDSATAAQELHDALLFADGDVAINLSAVSFIDSTALRVLVEAQSSMNRHGSRLEVRTSSSFASRVLSNAGIRVVVWPPSRGARGAGADRLPPLGENADGSDRHGAAGASYTAPR